jgi:hypothetical protein
MTQAELALAKLGRAYQYVYDSRCNRPADEIGPPLADLDADTRYALSILQRCAISVAADLSA